VAYALAYTRTRFDEDPGAIGANLGELEDLLARTRSTSRAIMSDLRPHLLDDLGFAEAARWIVANMAERTGIEATLRVEGDDAAIEGEPRTAALRILQEALMNVERHAEAAHVGVQLRIGPEALDLSVADDGRGIGARESAPGKRRGMGLLGMRERAAALGGTAEASMRSEGGTVVRCRLPVAKRAGTTALAAGDAGADAVPEVRS
jgi:signal transduction histidine kinase